MTDDELGIAWYNRLTKLKRAEWHRIAGSAVPKDAWEAFKLRPDPIHNTQGAIPNSHWENEPTYPAKNTSPLSQEWIEKIEKFRDPKYHTGDVIGPF